MMAQFMTNDRADATIVDRRIGIGIEERRLQDCGWKHDLDHAEIGIGIDLHRRHAPFPSVDGLTQLTNFIVVLKLARTQRIAEQRSEEHTSELQSLMRISYAVFCLKKKNQ